MIPAKGGNRRKYGGTTTRHNFRKGDYVEAEKAKRGGLGRGFQAPELNSGDSPLGFPHVLKDTPSDKPSLKEAGVVYQGWCSGDTAKQVSVSTATWKRIGQFTASKVRLLQRSTGLICKRENKFSVAS